MIIICVFIFHLLYSSLPDPSYTQMYVPSKMIVILYPLVVLQRSLHVEECQPGEAGWSVGHLDQVRLVLALLRDGRALQNAAVQQPSVRSPPHTAGSLEVESCVTETVSLYVQHNKTS